jgi:hypothetical protein
MTLVARTSDWMIRPFERSGLAPWLLGLAIVIGWLLFAAFVHGIAHLLVGPAELAFGVESFTWSIVVNGVLIGVMLAGHAHLHRGAVSDLRQLRPLLPDDDAAFAELVDHVPNLSVSMLWLATFGGMAGGLAVATLDPTLHDLYEHVPLSDPRYLFYLIQNMAFGVLGTRLFVAEVHMTRAYARLGERVEVDLLDLSLLLIFARKGLRSIVIWVLVSSAFSMFWVLDSAGQINVFVPILILAIATTALVAPTLGVHHSIARAKAAELSIVNDAIRSERAKTLAPRAADSAAEDARLGNLIQYQAFVKSVREWPFDLSIVARSVLLVVLGAGSWVGGAIVERLLTAALE